MPKTQNTITGTVKLGRWIYPARQHAEGDPGTFRNTKKDGSGQWVELEDASKFVADAQSAPKPSPVPQSVAKPLAKAGLTLVGSKPKPATKGKAPAKPKQVWVIGGKCPNGHKLTADTLYAMPSGRHQCKSCRRAYASNGSAKAAK